MPHGHVATFSVINKRLRMYPSCATEPWCVPVSRYVVITKKQGELYLGSSQWLAFSCDCHRKLCFLFSHPGAMQRMG